jgi:hypothetical protein
MPFCFSTRNRKGAADFLNKLHPIKFDPYSIAVMCYRTKLTATISQIEDKFEGRLEPVPELFNPGLELNGFAMPHTPVLCADDLAHLKIIQWGYEVNWQTVPLLNAQFETAQDKMSFKPYLHQRCLIAADGFYEWKWLDEKGKKRKNIYCNYPMNLCFFCVVNFAIAPIPIPVRSIVHTSFILCRPKG